jgi:hypothetical protein
MLAQLTVLFDGPEASTALKNAKLGGFCRVKMAMRFFDDALAISYLCKERRAAPRSNPAAGFDRRHY